MVSATDDALIVANNSFYASGSAARSVSSFFRERVTIISARSFRFS
jgi:hypothetical protein